MKKIVLATTNKGKLSEFNEMGKRINVEFITVDMPEINEDGNSFEENSLIKAKTIMKLTNMPVIADDSGLCVKCLDDKPGISTARFANHLDTYDKRCEYMIEQVNEKNSDRDAYFVCNIALIYPSGEYHHFRGEVHGYIADKLYGTNGHGYDPIFFSPELNKTFGQASLEEKSSVSHRGRAFKKLEEFFNEQI